MLPVGATLRVLGDGRAGHEAQSLGVAEALGAEPDLRRIAPRRVFEWLAPYGPMDPRDADAVTPPWPDIAIAAGRRTIPALRRLKHDSGGRTFTVYMNRPATGAATADLIVAPHHDGFGGANVITPAIPANRLSAKILAATRIAPDPRVAALPCPRIALLIGGDSRHFRFTDVDATKLAAAVRQIFAGGASVMATISRRTPAPVAQALKAAIAEGPGFLWDGGDPNPYISILACADALLVTADSVNMTGEAAATGAPVHVFWPDGGHPRFAAFHAALAETGASRTWRGSLQSWSYPPVNTTPAIAEAVLAAFTGARVRSCGRTHNR
jgi:mitochondrial fission protein ELM1